MEHITIERLGLQGDGIGHDATGAELFAPFTLPGEVITGEREGARIVQPKIVTPSAHRVAAPCPHFKSCGGCSVQHASDAFVADWKQEAVIRALGARDITAPFRPIATSAPYSRRRASFAGRRTKKGTMIGFHARATDQLIPISTCLVVDPALMAAIPALEALTFIAASRKGAVKFAVTTGPSGLDVSVTEAKAVEGPAIQSLVKLAHEHNIARLSWNGDIIVTRLPPTQMMGRASVTPPPGAFLQATKDGEAALTAAMLEAIGPAKRVVDLFAGCGTFTLPLAEKAEVHAVESEAAMLKALDAGWRQAKGLRTISTETRDLFRRPLLPLELKGYDAVVIDPPRAGAASQIAALAESHIKRIGSVSCNTITFARDAETLKHAGFTLDWVQVVDQFRWSGHIEIAAQFTR